MLCLICLTLHLNLSLVFIQVCTANALIEARLSHDLCKLRLFGSVRQACSSSLLLYSSIQVPFSCLSRTSRETDTHCHPSRRHPDVTSSVWMFTNTLILPCTRVWNPMWIIRTYTYLSIYLNTCAVYYVQCCKRCLLWYRRNPVITRSDINQIPLITGSFFWSPFFFFFYFLKMLSIVKISLFIIM